MTRMLNLFRTAAMLLLVSLIAAPCLAAPSDESREIPVGTVLSGETKDPAVAPEEFPRLPRSSEKGWRPLGLGGGGGTYNPSFSPFDPDLVLLATDMGATFRSEDAGENWEIIHRENGLYRMQFSTKPAYFRDRIYWPRGSTHELRFTVDKGLNWYALEAVPWGKSKILDVCALPGTPDVLLVGTESGLWLTDNHASSWRKVLSGEINLLSDSGRTIYAIEGADQILSSKDRGYSWGNAVSLGAFGAVKAMSASAGPEGEAVLVSADPAGLLASLDGGTRWTVIKKTYADETVVHIPPGQTRCMYAAQTGKRHNRELLKSDDYGKSWKSVFRMQKAGFIFGEKANVETSWVQTVLRWNYYITRNGFSVNPLNGNEMILTTQGDIYKSDNQGETWYQVMTSHVSHGQGKRYNQSIGLEITSAWGFHYDPHDHERMYISYTDIGFAHSVDRGKSWAWSAHGSPWTNTFYDVAIDPDVPGRLYAAASQLHDIPYDNFLRPITPKRPIHTKGGVVVSDDSGESWHVPYGDTAFGGLPAQVCTTVALDAASPPDSRVLYAGVFGEGDDDSAGVYKSTDGGRTWSLKSKGLGHLHSPTGMRNLHVYRVRVHPESGNVYCLITGLRGSSPEVTYKIPGGLWRSIDGGETWSDISGGQNLVWQSTAFCFDPTDEDIIYVTAASPLGRWRQGGVFRTMDGGNSWERIFPRDGKKDTAGYQLMSVAVHPENPKLIYVGDAYSGLYYSEDFGKTFVPYISYPGAPIQSISFNPSNLKEIFVTSFGTGVWRAPYIQITK
jgi:photosystem II stability/assembly factor-like uncharacterized protein